MTQCAFIRLSSHETINMSVSNACKIFTAIESSIITREIETLKLGDNLSTIKVQLGDNQFSLARFVHSHTSAFQAPNDMYSRHTCEFWFLTQ